MKITIDEIRRILKQCHNGDLNVLKKFHEEHSEVPLDILQDPISGDTILHHAARQGHLEMVEYLVTHFHVDCRNKDNKTPLHEACQFSQVEIANILLQNGADVNALKKADWTPLMLGCTKIQVPRSYNLIKLLLKHNTHTNFQNKDGWSSLHLIVREGNLEILKLLITHGLNVLQRTKNGNTALHIAALHKHYEIFQYLLSINHDLLLCENNQGNLPLHEAVLSQDINNFKSIVSHYSSNDLGKETKSGFNIMHLAAFIGSLDILQIIVDTLKLDVHKVTSHEQQNMLHLSARNQYWHIYKYCLKLGVDQTVKDKYGRLPCDYNKYIGEL